MNMHLANRFSTRADAHSLFCSVGVEGLPPMAWGAPAFVVGRGRGRRQCLLRTSLFTTRLSRSRRGLAPCSRLFTAGTWLWIAGSAGAGRPATRMGHVQRQVSNLRSVRGTLEIRGRAHAVPSIPVTTLEDLHRNCAACCPLLRDVFFHANRVSIVFDGETFNGGYRFGGRLP